MTVKLIALVSNMLSRVETENENEPDNVNNLRFLYYLRIGIFSFKILLGPISFCFRVCMYMVEGFALRFVFE